MEIKTVLIAFGLTLLAGLSTGIGSSLALFTKRTNTKFLSLALGFSAGVMIYVSFVEIFFKAKNILTADHVFGAKLGTWITVLSFFGGMALIAIIDRLVPKVDNPHEMHKVEELENGSHKNRRLARMGSLTALAIAIHNFPEGLATFAAAISDPSLGIAIAVAIAIHNIPEGIAVSVPVYYATGSRKKAFWLSFSSGLAEPIGAIIGFLILMPFMGDSKILMGIIFAVVAGIMVFISFDELLPAAEEYGEHHLSVYGMVAGMVVMAFSLLMFI